MTYAFPTVSDLLSRVRTLLEAYRERRRRTSGPGAARRLVGPHPARQAGRRAMPEDLLPMEDRGGRLGRAWTPGWRRWPTVRGAWRSASPIEHAAAHGERELEEQVGFGRAPCSAGMGFPAGMLVQW
jgi:hypothetical protein